MRQLQQKAEEITYLLLEHERGVAIFIILASLDLLLEHGNLLLLLGELLVVRSLFLDEALDGASGDGER